MSPSPFSIKIWVWIIVTAKMFRYIWEKQSYGIMDFKIKWTTSIKRQKKLNFWVEPLLKHIQKKVNPLKRNLNIGRSAIVRTDEKCCQNPGSWTIRQRIEFESLLFLWYWPILVNKGCKSVRKIRRNKKNIYIHTYLCMYMCVHFCHLYWADTFH